MHQVISFLRRYLARFLDRQRSLASSAGEASRLFSILNPINTLVQDANDVTATTHLCVIEACSGSGKSLCAADYFVRNSDQCIYFLFNPSKNENKQNLYQNVSSITNLMGLAMNCDLISLIRSTTPTLSTELLGVLDFDLKESERKWYLLGALGYLWKETTTVAPVSVKEAMNWKQRWVLMDETIPPEQDFAAIAKLVLVKRVLTNANIHCIMLGTNTLVMNFDKISRSSKYSRDEDRTMLCLTHRSLPRYILPSSKDEELLKKFFGESRVSQLLDNVNPWLCSLFLSNLRRIPEIKNPSSLIRNISRAVLLRVKRDKRSLKDESIYCMFQISAHEPVSQLHISKGFAQLNVWDSNSPRRGSKESMPEMTRLENEVELRIHDTPLPELTASFPPAVQDPITVAVCAGGGRPFGQRSALQVLQGIHKQKAVWSNPINVDAYKRDANELESFGAVVLMISSWSPCQDLLKNIAYHCGIQEDQPSVGEIQRLASVRNKKSFMRILKSCVSNLAPVRWSERRDAASPFMGYYIRNQDRQSRDGTFTGPTSASKKSLMGGAEYKNWNSPLTPEQLSKVLSKLLKQDLDVNVCMVPEISFNVTESNLTGIIKNTTIQCKTEWLVLHLKGEGWRSSSFQIDAFDGNQTMKRDEQCVPKQAGVDLELEPVKRKVLMIIEIGIKTQPFCGKGRYVQCPRRNKRRDQRGRSKENVSEPTKKRKRNVDK